MRKLFIVALVVAAVVGCGNYADPSGGEVYLNLDFADSGALRSILPPGDMTVTEYIVTGDGPGSASYSATLTEDTVLGGLLPGAWTFSAVAQNAAHVALGAGTGSCTVVIGDAVTCTIVVNEYLTPDGSFSLALSWEPAIVLDPVWTGSLKNFAAVTTPLTFVTNEPACTSTTAVDPLAVGWYTLIVRLWDAPAGMDGSEVLSTGAATAVRVAAGQETHGDLALHAVQGFGSLELDFDLNMNDPLVLTPNIPFGTVEIYNDQTQAFSLTADEACTTIYYLRGSQVGVDSYTVTANDLTAGEEYRLDAVAFNIDGTRAASDTWRITHVDLNPELLLVAGTANNSDQNDIRVALVLASDWTQIVAMGPRSGEVSYVFSFPLVEPGDYYLLEFADGDNDAVWEASDGNPGAQGRYWPNLTGQAPGAPVGGAQMITIPLVAAQPFNWATNLANW